MINIYFSFFLILTKALNIDIFIESQCPDTVRLLKNMQPLLNQTEILEEIQLNFIPFGKGSEKLLVGEGYQFTCQHGNKECYGNLIDSCVLEQLDKIEQLRFLTCIHEKKQNSEEMINLHLKKCTQEHECLYERTLKCISSKYGNYLQHKAAKFTLMQKLTEIPWINIDGFHDKEFDKLFRQNPLKAICTKIDCEKYKIKL